MKVFESSSYSKYECWFPRTPGSLEIKCKKLICSTVLHAGHLARKTRQQTSIFEADQRRIGDEFRKRFLKNLLDLLFNWLFSQRL